MFDFYFYRKIGGRQTKKNSAKKNSARKNSTKKNSAKKSKPTPKKKVETSTYKRALFQSPDQLPSANEAQTPNTQRVHCSKRNLFANSSGEKKVNVNGKRERMTANKMSPRKRVNRSLSFQSVPQESTCPQTSVPQPAQTSITLSAAHKQVQKGYLDCLGEFKISSYKLALLRVSGRRALSLLLINTPSCCLLYRYILRLQAVVSMLWYLNCLYIANIHLSVLCIVSLQFSFIYNQI